MIRLNHKSVFKFWIVCLGAILLFLNFCKKDEMPHYFIPTTLLAYSDFQLGSYWIYYDTKNHLLDSTYITDKTFETINSNEGHVNTNQYDQSKINFSSHVYVLSKTFAYNGGGMMEIKFFDSTYGILDTWMFENPDKYQNWYVVYYPTYTLGGKTYSDVYQSRTNEFNGSSTISNDAFFAKNFGIIRAITKINQDTTFSWSLIRSRIIK